MGAREWSADPAQCAPARKPLYLALRERMQVSAQAQSLVVRTSRGAPRRFPITRIDRIACNRNTDWTGEALALCLVHGITLTWIDAAGQPLGDCSPCLTRPDALHALLSRFVESPGWREGYDNWLRQRRMAVLVGWAAERAEAGEAPTREDWESLKRDYVYRGHVRERLGGDLPGWCRAQVCARLWTAGVERRYWGHDGSVLDLGGNLTQLLWARLNLDAGALMAGSATARALALAFEAGIDRRDAQLAEHLAQLKRFVHQAVQSWL